MNFGNYEFFSAYMTLEKRFNRGMVNVGSVEDVAEKFVGEFGGQKMG